MQTEQDVPAQDGSEMLGQSVVITGKLEANEDLTIEGHVEGTIESNLHSVTIGQKATAKAKIVAKEVVVLGKVAGDIQASDKIEIWPSGTVEGDIVSPTVTIAEGATFRGSVDMTRREVQPTNTAETQPSADQTRRLEIDVDPAAGNLQRPLVNDQGDAPYAA